MASWEEWEDEEECKPERSSKQEEWLWKRLEESDRQQAKEAKYKEIKKSRKVAKSREKMKVGSNQPSIKEQMVKSSQVQENCQRGREEQAEVTRKSAKRDRPAERAVQPVQLTTMSNGPSKGPPVTLGQSNRFPIPP